MKRRKFAWITGMGFVALSVPLGCSQFTKPEYDPLLTEPEILSHIWDGATIKEVGSLYRKMFSDENSEATLVSLLTTNYSEDLIPATKMLQQQISRDYEQGDIVMIDGWLLSRTEARQCALFSLTQNN